MLLECPKCLWLHYNEKYQRPRGIFPSLPGGMDNVFKAYFDEHRAQGTLPPEIDGKVGQAKLYEDLVKLDGWRNNRVGIKAEFEEFDMLLKGAIDDLLVDPDGSFLMFDFKTRGWPTKPDSSKYYLNQLNLYGLLFKENGYDVGNRGYLLFFWPTSFALGNGQFATDLVEIPIDPEAGRAVLKRAHDIITSPMPSPAGTCEFCAYREAGAKLETRQTLL